jgi:hypothetical protein
MKTPGITPLLRFAISLMVLPVFGQPPTATALDLNPDANGKLSQAQMQDLFRVVAEKDLENDKRLRDYTYIERDEEHRVDGKGAVKFHRGEDLRSDGALRRAGAAADRKRR